MNLLGEVVYRSDQKMDQGRHTIELDAAILPAGVYYYALEFKGIRLVRKMVVE